MMKLLVILCGLTFGFSIISMQPNQPSKEYKEFLKTIWKGMPIEDKRTHIELYGPSISDFSDVGGESNDVNDVIEETSCEENK
jgi:hypothetical protein